MRHPLPNPIPAGRLAIVVALAVSLAAVAGGCGRRERADETAVRDTVAAQPRSWLDLLPATRRDSVQVEGMSEAATSRLFRGTDHHAVFWTPHPITAEPEPGSHGEAARLLWVGGGTPRPFGMVRFLGEAGLPPPPVGSEPRTPRAWDWTEAEYVAVRGENVLERFDGMHRGKAFTVELDYPAEWGDGLGPRLVLLFDSWIWVDTGRNLAEEAERRSTAR